MNELYYKLIKLQVELFEYFPFDFDPNEITEDHFTFNGIIENLNTYFEEYENKDITDFEIDLKEKFEAIKKEITEYNEDKIVKISYELKIKSDLPLSDTELQTITGVIEERIEVEKNHKDTFKFTFTND